MSIVNKALADKADLNLNKFGEYLVKIERLITCVLNFLVILLICISTLLAVVSVVLRFGFSISYPVVEELCRYAVIYAVMLAFGPLITKNSHLAMGLVTERLSSKAFRVFDICVYVLLTFVLVALFIGAFYWESALISMGMKTMSGVMAAWMPSAALPIGLFIGAIYALIRAVYRYYDIPMNVLQASE